MDFQMVSDNKIKITLKREDMQKLDINYSEFDYSSMNTRRIIWTLLCEAKNSLAVDIDLFSKMMIEVLPEKEEGCIVYFTLLEEDACCGQSKIMIRKNMKPCIFEFTSVEELMSALEGLGSFPQDTLNDSELFLMERHYRLILNTVGRSTVSLPDYFSEFGSYIGEGNAIASYTREHGKMLADAKGVKKLAYL